MNRKQITLPSGATVLVRKMSQWDFLELGEAPAALADNVRKAETLTPKQVQWSAKVNRIILAKCTGPVVGADGSWRRIVDKPFSDCTEAELCIDEMNDQDVDAIVTAVTELTQAGREAGAKARAFPQEQTVAADAGPNGAPLPNAAEPATQAPVG